MSREHFSALFDRVHYSISDRIGLGILHGRYDDRAPQFTVPSQESFRDQYEDAYQAFADLTNFDSHSRRRPAVALLLLPPAELLELSTDPSDQISQRFLEDYSGTSVVDPNNHVKGVSDRWEIAVTQGDWSMNTHPYHDPDEAALPSYMERMTDLFPLGYVALGGSVDREELQWTALVTHNPDGSVSRSYGAYRHSRPQSSQRKNHQSAMSDGSYGPAEIIISSEPPRPKSQLVNRTRPAPVRRRFTYHTGQER